MTLPPFDIDTLRDAAVMLDSQAMTLRMSNSDWRPGMAPEKSNWFRADREKKLHDDMRKTVDRLYEIAQRNEEFACHG